MVDQVEHLQETIDPRAAGELKMSLDPKVHPMDGLPDQVVARHNGAVRA